MSEHGDYSGVDRSLFMSIEQARSTYGLGVRDSLFASDFNQRLEADGIAPVRLSLPQGDFETLVESYEACLDACPEELKATYHSVDFRHGKDAGQVRKEKKMRDGVQIEDPKNYFHFNEYASIRWSEQFADAPKLMRQFLEQGAEVQAALVELACGRFEELEETHPNITRAHFKGDQVRRISCSFLRILSYDGYALDQTMGDVAKPHFDIGNATIQAYADAPGFWVAPDGASGERIYYPGELDEAYLFMGYAHKKLYGGESPLKPLWHGVERINPPGTTEVPKRHSVILFVDTPYVNDEVKPEETLPYVQHAETAVA